MVNKTIPSPHNTWVNPKSRPNHTTSSYYDQCFRRTLLVFKINIMQMVRITSCISSDNRISSLFTFFLVINLSVPLECDFKFTKEPSQHTHMQVHTEVKPFSCKVCFRLIPLVCKTTIMQLVYLISYMSPSNIISLLFTIFLVFTECDFKYTIEPNQHTHMSIHSEEKPFSCSVCDYNYNKQFKCISILLVKNLSVFTECDFKYTLEPNQHTHMSIHSEEKPFSCSVCDCNSNKQIECISILLVKNLFVFTKCDFKYTLEPDKHTHMSIHSEEKPISCSVCDCNSNKQIKYIPIHTGVISTYTNKYKFNLANISIIILLIIMKNNYISNG